jgi:hypothetical protein
VPLTILYKSSEKLVEFCFEGIERKNNAETVDLKRKFDIVVVVNLCKKTKNRGKVTQFL